MPKSTFILSRFSCGQRFRPLALAGRTVALRAVARRREGFGVGTLLGRLLDVAGMGLVGKSPGRLTGPGRSKRGNKCSYMKGLSYIDAKVAPEWASGYLLFC